MSIQARCRCGKSFQVKNSAAGKKFRCTECGAAVQVPQPAVDDLEVYDEPDEEEEEYEEEFRPIARRKQKKRNSKAMPNAQDILLEAGKELPVFFARILGTINGVTGFLIAGIYFILATINLWSFRLLLILIFGALAMMAWIGAKAACGYGLSASHSFKWTGIGSIIAGMFLIWLSVAIPIAVFQISFIH